MQSILHFARFLTFQGPSQLQKEVKAKADQVLDDASQRVSMSSDEDALASLDFRNDDVIPVGQRSLNGQLQALGLRELVAERAVFVPGNHKSSVTD